MIRVATRAGAVCVAGAALACIIPDRGISFTGGPANPGAVRISERPPIDPQMDDFCNVEIDRELKRPSNDDLSFCPQVPRSRPGGLVRVNEPLCVCPPSQRDARAIPPFAIYAEDPDVTSEQDPVDTLYGVLLLDPDPESDAPQRSVAYLNYFGNCQEGIYLRIQGDGFDAGSPDLGHDRTAVPDARDPPGLWVFHVDDLSDRGIDLCNDDNGARVAPGLHTLRFLVTDRPFFRPERPDGTGLGPVQCGVPDLAIGATYAVVDYVFECVDATADPDACDCVEAR